MSSDTEMTVFLVGLATLLGFLVASIYHEFSPLTPGEWWRLRQRDRRARKDNAKRLELIANQTLKAQIEQVHIDAAVAEALLQYRIDTQVNLAINKAYESDYQARKTKEKQ